MDESTKALAGDGLIPAVRGEGMLFDGARPLVFADLPVVLAWSPKSACTHVLVWFLAQEGLVRAAEYFGPWPHDFRGKVYYRTLSYRRAATRMLKANGKGHTLIRVTRSPHKRLVSIFRHALRHGLLAEVAQGPLARDMDATEFSLREMGQILQGCNLTTPTDMNMHLCAQYHPIWDLGFDRVITLNVDETPLDDGLRAIEQDLGLPEVHVEKLPYFKAVQDRHYAQDVPYIDNGPVEHARFRAEPGQVFPKRALEATALARDLSVRLHEADIGRVASGDTAGRLFG